MLQYKLTVEELFEKTKQSLTEFNTKLEEIKVDTPNAYNVITNFMKSQGSYSSLRNDLADLKTNHDLEGLEVDIDHVIPKDVFKILENIGETNSEIYKYFLEEYGTGGKVDPNMLPCVPARRAAHRNQMTSGNQGKYREHMARAILKDDLNRLSHYVDYGTDPYGKFKMYKLRRAFDEDDEYHRCTRTICSVILKKCSDKTGIPYIQQEYNNNRRHRYSRMSEDDVILTYKTGVFGAFATNTADEQYKKIKLMKDEVNQYLVAESYEQYIDPPEEEEYPAPSESSEEEENSASS